jgi:hypothetical protein
MYLLLDFREGRDSNIDWCSKGVEERSLYWLESRWITPSLTLAQAQPPMLKVTR